MARQRNDDDFTDDPPRRRRRDDEDEDDRPRRRARRDDDDDYDDRPRRRRSEPEKLTGLDGTFANTNIVMLILFSCLCGDIALLLGIVGLVACKDARARKNALIVTCISGVRAAITVAAIIISNVIK